MANFRNRLLLFVGVSAVFTGLAGAQTLSCTTGNGGASPVPVAVPPGTNPPATGWYGPIGSPGTGTIPTQPIELRSEGATELVSDTVFNCDGTAVPLQGQVTAYVNGNVPGLGITGFSPVLQIIDNSGGGNATVYYQGVLVGNQISNGVQTVASQQVIFGTLAVGTALYTGGPVSFPSYNFILRVSNIRVNVTGLPNPNIPTPVTETVFAGAQGVATLFQSLPITVGYVLRSLNVTQGTNPKPASYLVCNSNGGGASFDVTVAELFAGAFKTPLAPPPTASIPAPANIPGGEQGTFTMAGGIEASPLGTRIKFVLANIPPGVTGLSVPNSIISADGVASNLELDFVTGGDTGTSAPVGAPGSTTIPVANGTVTAVYQVNTENLAVIKKFDFTPTLIFGANAVTLTGAASQVTVTTSYAPSPATVGGAINVPTTYLPYFANTGVTTNGPTWSTCETDLLFPFVSTVGGFDTGLAIANTAADPFGTTGQAGTCALYYYGTGQVPAATNPVTPTTTGMTAAIATGTVGMTTSAAYVGTNFSGYVIARCNFLYAHGYGFILGLTAFAPNSAAGGSALTGGTYFTQGYEALILANGPTPRVATNNGAENLNQ